jgi:dihydropyrimidinase
VSTLLIKNGTIVTATDRYTGDVFVEGEAHLDDRHGAPMPADRTIDAAGKYVLPGGIDVHTHLDMPFGGTTSADDFESGHRLPPRTAARPTIVDFAIQYRGPDAAPRLGHWMKKAEGKAAIDYGFHMIITGALRPGRAGDGCAGRAGRSRRSSCSWPIPAFSCSTTPASSGPCCAPAERRHHLHARRERRRDRRAGEEGARRGKTAPKYHALTAPGAGRGRGDAPGASRWPRWPDVPIYIVHLSAAEALEMVTEARDRGLPAYAETCPQYLFLSYDNYESRASTAPST